MKRFIAGVLLGALAVAGVTGASLNEQDPLCNGHICYLDSVHVWQMSDSLYLCNMYFDDGIDGPIPASQFVDLRDMGLR